MRLKDADALCKPMYAEKGNVAGFGMTNDEMDAYNIGLDTAWRQIEKAPTVDAEPVQHGHWEIEIISPTGADIIKAIGRCSYCGCDDSVPHKSAMGYYKGIPVVWSGFITNYFGHETEAAEFASANADEMPKRRYCPNCGAKMDGKTSPEAEN